MSQNQMTIPAWITRSTGATALSRNVFLVVAGSLLIALAAQVSVPLPFTPVPMTLQPMAVLLVGALLGARRGGAAAALYLLEGAAGLPFFAGGHAGIHWLSVGATAGYLLSYPLVASVVGWFSDRGWTRSVPLTIAMMAIGISLIHLGGWSWLVTMIPGMTPKSAFLAGNLPFFGGDLVKIGLAAALLPILQRYVSGRSDSGDSTQP